MRKPKSFLSGLLIASALLAGCVNEDEPKGPSLSVGDPLPVFSVEMNTGYTVSTQSLEGKVAVIVFFNTGCPDCQKELPVIQTIWETCQDASDVEVVCIAREETEVEIEEYWVANNLSMPYSPQDNREVYNLFAPSIIPRVYVANPNGIITASYGDTDLPSLQTLINDIHNSQKQ